MKEYKCVQIGYEGIDTERMLNSLAKEGWQLVCSYAHNNQWLILQREKKTCKRCGK